MRKTGGFFLKPGENELVEGGEFFREEALSKIRKSFGPKANRRPVVFFGDYERGEWACYGNPAYPDKYLELAKNLAEDGNVSSKFSIGRERPQGVAVFSVSGGEIKFLKGLAEIFDLSEETAFRAVLAEELTHGALPQEEKFSCRVGPERPNYPKGSYGELLWELGGIYRLGSFVLAPAEFFGALGTGLLVPEAELSFRAYDAAGGKAALKGTLYKDELAHYARHIPGHAARELSARSGGAKRFLEKNPEVMEISPERLFEKYVFPVQAPVYRI